MANYAVLKEAIDNAIKANWQREITGDILNQVLTAMVNSLGNNYQFAGVATPTTNPGQPDQNVFYMAIQAGTYTNFSAIVLQAGISILLWDGSWSSETFFTIDSVPTSESTNLISSGAVFEKFKLDGGAYDVSAHNSGATFASLSALLNSENLNTLIPVAVRHGGMSIKFVQSSDNKYVQYRYKETVTTAATFTNVANWEKINNVSVEEVSQFQQLPFEFGAITSSGETSEDTNWIKTDYIEAPVGTQFNVNLKGNGGVHTISLYDSSKNVISYEVRELSDSVWTNIDQNVAFVRFSGKSAKYGDYTPFIKKQEFIKEISSEIVKHVEIGLDIPFEQGAIANSGESSDDPNWVKTDYIATEFGQRIHVNLKGENSHRNVRTINLYDSSKNLIDYETIDLLDYDWVNQFSNVAYIRFSGKSATYGDYTPIVKILNYYPSEIIPNLISDVKDNTADILELKDDVEELGQQTDIEIVIPFENGAITSSGETSGDTNWVKTDYITTPVGRKIYVNLVGNNSGVHTISLYDSSKNLITAGNYNLSGFNWTNSDPNVAYIRFSGKSAKYGDYIPIVKVLNCYPSEILSNTNTDNLNLYSDIDKLKDVTKLNTYSSILQNCQDVVANCMRETNDNVLVMLPDANGSYGAFWVRDFAMSLDGNINLTPTDVLAAYNLIKSKVPNTGEKAFWVPDHIMMDGTPIWKPGTYEETGGWGYRASLDGAGFLVKIADYYVKSTHDISFINDNIDFLYNIINSLLTNNLVYIESGQESCVFGFYDTVKFNGAIAYNTIQCYESLKILKEWAEIAGLSREYPTNAIKDAFNDTFVVKVNRTWTNSHSISFDTMKYAYVKSATGLNSGRFDVWATLYAIRCGILTDKNEILCCQGIVEFYDEIIKNGQAKHVPNSFYYSQSAMWESYFQTPTLGTYQNGGYWFTPIYDMIYALKKVNVPLADQLYREALKYAVIADYCEYSTEGGSTAKTRYATSATAISMCITQK